VDWNKVLPATPANHQAQKTTDMAHSMPRRGAREAPLYYPDQPILIRDYFMHLEQLLDECKVATEQEKKTWTVFYLDFYTRKRWEDMEEFADNLKTYLDLKKAILELYFDTGDIEHTLADLDILIGNTQRAGIYSLADLTKYQLQFNDITKYLIKKKKLASLQLTDLFLRGLQPTLWDRLLKRLQIKFPDHYEDEPYELTDIQAAAKHILHGTPTMLNQAASPNPTLAYNPTTSTMQSNVKKEQYDLSQYGQATQVPNADSTTLANLVSLLHDLAKDVKVLKQERNPNTNNGNAYTGSRQQGCNFCSDPNHRLPQCPNLEDYSIKGLCKRDIKNFITLPDNSNIGRNLLGRNLMERIDNWHKANPSQIHKVSTNFISATLTSDSKQTYTWNKEEPNSVSTNIVEITEEDEDDYSLLTIREVEELPMLETVLVNTQKKIDETKKKLANDHNTRSKAKNKEAEPIEPKKPSNKNIGNNTAPQYKYITPIEDTKIVSDIVKRSLDTNITLSN
jgi:hypothetical protein